MEYYLSGIYKIKLTDKLSFDVKETQVRIIKNHEIDLDVLQSYITKILYYDDCCDEETRRYFIKGASRNNPPIVGICYDNIHKRYIFVPIHLYNIWANYRFLDFVAVVVFPNRHHSKRKGIMKKLKKIDWNGWQYTFSEGLEINGELCRPKPIWREF